MRANPVGRNRNVVRDTGPGPTDGRTNGTAQRTHASTKRTGRKSTHTTPSGRGREGLCRRQPKQLPICWIRGVCTRSLLLSSRELASRL
eukprot:7047190-Prymnesium_polylepis.1